MRITDIGELYGEVLLFGGIYSNFEALNAVIERAQARGIPPGNMICSGDLVAYCADGQACVDRIRGLGCPVLLGNCELQLSKNADDCGCGYDEGSTCSILSRSWYAHAQNEITIDSKSWMGELPERIIFTHSGKRYSVVHGGASGISSFVWPIVPDVELLLEINILQSQVGPIDGVIAGHTGIGMDRSVNGIRWINPGAVGMPPNDGDPRGAYAILNGDELTRKRFTYDTARSIAAMHAAGLTQGYDTALETGFWPSEDTLPQIMRHQSSAKG